MGAGPAYKPQEDYYDEVIELKKVRTKFYLLLF